MTSPKPRDRSRPPTRPPHHSIGHSVECEIARHQATWDRRLRPPNARHGHEMVDRMWLRSETVRSAAAWAERAPIHAFGRASRSLAVDQERSPQVL
jgi:hypothetical protein